MELLNKLAELKNRFLEVNGILGDPAIYADSERERFKSLTKELKELEPLAKLHDLLAAALGNIETARELIEITQGEEREASQRELEEFQAQVESITQQAKARLMPSDPRDARPVILEVRSGTGGEEAALFAGELVEMYRRYAESQDWEWNVLDAAEADQGGIKEAVIEIVGTRAFSKLRWESGTHRVQRVPVTETQGRIHTSAATVAVLSEPPASEISLADKDLKIDTYRSSGAGGQHVNKTSSAIRITHLPTGTVVTSQDQRSQHQNKEKAMQVLMARLQQADEGSTHAAQSEDRKSQVGSGDRSEKIRTYNFPQNRVTDHRINKTIHNIPAVMGGDLDGLITELMIAAEAEAMASTGGD